MILVVLAVAWLAAIASVAIWALPAWSVPALIACFVPVTFMVRGRTWALTLAAACVLALVGGLRFSNWEHRASPTLAAFVGQEVTIDGVIDSEPQPAETTAAFVVRVRRVQSDGSWLGVNGKLRASLDQYAHFLPGTPVSLSGVLEDPPVFPDFDYRSYLARQDIVATMYLPAVAVTGPPPRWDAARMVTQARLALDRSLQRSLPEPEASLAGGIAFGRDGNLPDELYSHFRDAGLAHIVAVSGSNVSLVAALTFALCTWLIGRRLAIIPATVTVAGYLLVAGLSASVTRAGVMAMVFLLGSFLGRQRSALSALGAAAIVMTLYQPAADLDIGFQLSLAATAGLIAFGPWLRLWLTRASVRVHAGWIPRAAIEVAALSTSATLATLPLVWIDFGRVSLIGPFANVLIEPLFVVAFWLGAMTAVCGVVWHPAGWAVGLVAYYPLSFTTWFARTAANLPFAAVDVPQATAAAAASVYAVVAAIGWLAYRRYAPEPPSTSAPFPADRIRKPIVAVAGAGIVACVVVPVSLWPARPPGELVVNVLAVGDGDAVLVTTPAGRHVLIDGGPSGIRLAQELGAVLPHWDRDIYEVVALGDAPEQNAGHAAIDARFDVARPAPAGAVDFEIDGVAFSTVDPNAGDETLRITYRGMSVLVPGDLTAAETSALAARTDTRATVLVVPHHGNSSGDIALVNAARAAVNVIPVATGLYALPPDVDLLSAAGHGAVLRTDDDGRIRLRLDGKRVQFQTQR